MRDELTITKTSLDDDVCRAWWLQLLHPDGPLCPRCKSSVTDRRVETWRAGGRVKCACGRWYDCRTGTPVQGMTADWRQLTMLMVLSFHSKPLPELAVACNLTPETIKRYLKRLRS